MRFLGLLLLFAVSVPVWSESYFEVVIMQYDVPVEIEDHEVELDRAPFQLVMIYTQPMGVLVNFSFDEEHYLGFEQGLDLDEIFENPNRFMGIAENSFNPDKCVTVDEYRSHKLDYQSAQNNRFDLINVGTNSIICTRTIESIQASEDTSDVLSISDITNRNIYMIFHYSEWDDNYERVELQRDYVKVSFRERA